MADHTYDIVENFLSWLPTNQCVTRYHPHRYWWQFWKPKLVQPRIYQKLVDGEWVRVAILLEYGQITYAESVE